MIFLVLVLTSVISTSCTHHKGSGPPQEAGAPPKDDEEFEKFLGQSTLIDYV